MLDTLDADAVRRWARAAVEALEAHRAEIDALNVFPVPDADTGANMLQTMRAGAQELAASPGSADRPAAALGALARGATLGAVGNSGFLLSQVLQGLAEAAGATEFGAATGEAWLSAGLDRGADLARAAVVAPVEGTILTVARAAADAARDRAGTPATLGDATTRATDAAAAALARTPSQLAALDGHVDAGGRGLVVVLDALTRVVTGRDTAAPVTADDQAVAGPTAATVHRPAPRPELPGGFGYEVQYLLEADDAAVEGLRGALADLGDSLAVVPAGDRLWKVHVHVDDVGAAIEAGVEAGRPHGISVVRFADQLSGVAADHGQGAASTSAVVAVAPGAGLAHLFQHEGVHVADAEEGDVDPAAVLDAIRGTGAREIVLLPSAARLTPIAESAAVSARAEGLRVSVVPTRSPVQVLAAVAVHDGGRRFDDDVVAMAEAAAATRFAELVVARERALTAVGICQPGDVLGLIDGEVVAIGRGLLAVGFGVVDRLLGVGAELMTVLVGPGAPHGTGELIEAHVRGRSPFTDVTVYESGEQDRPVIIGVE